jgi:hypothetical protein
LLPARTEERAGIDWAESHHDVAIIGDSGPMMDHPGLTQME